MKKEEEKKKSNIQKKAQCAKANRASPVYIDRDYAMLKKKTRDTRWKWKTTKQGRVRTASFICDPLGCLLRHRPASPAAPSPQMDLGPSQGLPARADTFLRQTCRAS